MMVPKKGHRLLHLQSPSSSNGATKNPTVTSSPSSFSYSFYITLLKGLIRTYPFHILLFCLIKLPEVGCHGNMLAKELTFMHDRRIQCKSYSPRSSITQTGGAKQATTKQINVKYHRAFSTHPHLYLFPPWNRAGEALL